MTKKIEELTIEGITYVPKGSEVTTVQNTEGLPFVMIRTYSAGVHMGYLEEKSKDGLQVKLLNSRRIFSWEGACSLSQLSQEGSTSIDNCKIAMAISELYLTQAIEIIPMPKKAVDNLNLAKVWKS